VKLIVVWLSRALFSQQQQSVGVPAEALPAVCKPGELASHDHTICDAFVLWQTFQSSWQRLTCHCCCRRWGLDGEPSDLRQQALTKAILLLEIVYERHVEVSEGYTHLCEGSCSGF
jgi:hypothetical protein